MLEIKVGSDNAKKIFPLITGKFSIDVDDDDTNNPAEILKNIICVVTRTENYQSFTPFQDVVVFSDDVIIDKNIISGVFSFDMMNFLKFSGSGEYYILCSIYSNLSNIIKIKIE